jgi:hypothetical protein
MVLLTNGYLLWDSFQVDIKTNVAYLFNFRLDFQKLNINILTCFLIFLGEEYVSKTFNNLLVKVVLHICIIFVHWNYE